MNFFFLQVTPSIDTTHHLTDSATAAVNAATTSSHMNLFDLLYNGGIIMIPLGLLFVLAVFFFFERWIAIRKASRIDPNFMNIIRDNVVTGNITAARALAKNTDNPVARMIDKGLQRIGKPIDAIEKSMENIGKLEIYSMEKNLSVLSLVYGIAPMFGFLGTIFGMLQLFYNINATGEFTPAAIAGGIYTKMTTSATG